MTSTDCLVIGRCSQIHLNNDHYISTLLFLISPSFISIKFLLPSNLCVSLLSALMVVSSFEILLLNQKKGLTVLQKTFYFD